MTKIFAVLAAFFLFSTGFIGGASTAAAHADLVSTDPVDGSALESAPESISLIFNSKILDSMIELAVSNSSGELIPGIVAESVRATATALWPADLPGDTYTVAYRIVSEDGHPVTDSFSFNYPESVSESEVATEVAEPQASPLETPPAEPTSPASASAGSGSGSGSGSMLGWVLGLLALALIVVGYFIWRKRSM